MHPCDEEKAASDSEQAVPRPRGRPRKGQPMQAAATSEEPTKLLGTGGTRPGTRHVGSRPDQDSKQIQCNEYGHLKRIRGSADQEAAMPGGCNEGQEQEFTAKRKRTELFNTKDLVASGAAEVFTGLQEQQLGLQDSMQQQQQSPLTEAHDWVAQGSQTHYLLLQQQQQGPRHSSSSSGATARLDPAMAAAIAAPGLQFPEHPAAAAAAAPPGGTQNVRGSSSLEPLQATAAADNDAASGGCSTRSGAHDADGAAPAEYAAAAGPSPIIGRPVSALAAAAAGASSDPAAAAAADSSVDFNPDLMPKGVARDMALQRERRVLAEAAQAELGPDSLSPDTNVATLVQRILKCGVLTRKAVEYRKRAKGMGPADYNKGVITSSGLIRCSCHGQDITMSEFEQHSNSQIHRPAEYIFIKSIDMSLKTFALLVLSKPVDSNLWYCLACNDGGELLCCDGCPAAFHLACLGAQHAPQPNSEWLCGDCLMAGKKPRWSARGPLRRYTPLSGAAGAASSTARRGSSATAAASNRYGAGGGRTSSEGMAGAGMGGGKRAANMPLPLKGGGGYGGSGYGSYPGGGCTGGPPAAGGFYETDEPHMGGGYGSLNPSAHYGGESALPNIWGARSQGWAMLGGSETLNPNTGLGLEPYVQGPANPVLGLKGSGGPVGGVYEVNPNPAVSSAVAPGYNAHTPVSDGYGRVIGTSNYAVMNSTAAKNESGGEAAYAGYQQQQQQGIEVGGAGLQPGQQQQTAAAGGVLDVLMQTLKEMSGPTADTLMQQLQQMQQQQQQRHVAPAAAAAPGGGMERQMQQQQQYGDSRSRYADAVTALHHAASPQPAAAAAYGSDRSATPNLVLQQQQQQHNGYDAVAVGNQDGWGTSHTTAAAASAQRQQQADLQALASAAAAKEVEMQQQQQAAVSSLPGAAAAADAAAAAELLAAALNPSGVSQSALLSRVLELSKQLLPSATAAPPSAAAAAERNAAEQGTPAKPASGAAEPPARLQQPQHTAAAASSEERRLAVAAALKAGSLLVGSVLGAQTLPEAQRAVAAAGAQLLASLGNLL